MGKHCRSVLLLAATSLLLLSGCHRRAPLTEDEARALVQRVSGGGFVESQAAPTTSWPRLGYDFEGGESGVAAHYTVDAATGVVMSHYKDIDAPWVPYPYGGGSESEALAAARSEVVRLLGEIPPRLQWTAENGPSGWEIRALEQDSLTVSLVGRTRKRLAMSVTSDGVPHFFFYSQARDRHMWVLPLVWTVIALPWYAFKLVARRRAARQAARES